MSPSPVLMQMSIADILTQYPQTATVFEKYGLHRYATSQTAQFENLEASALVHSLNLNQLVSDLNHVIQG